MSERADIKQALLKIENEFVKTGTSDPITILEYIAFFMLCRYAGDWDGLEREIAYSSSGNQTIGNSLNSYLTPYSVMRGSDDQLGHLLPPAPTDVPASSLTGIVELVNSIKPGELGKVFNEVLLARTIEMQAGGRYATPRHLPRFMAGLVNLQPQDTVADLACGSGGMLVAARNCKRVVGIEISTNWAHLAFTNLRLNGIDHHDLYLGNTFSFFRPAEIPELQPSIPPFKIVLMNPPFGETIEPELVQAIFEKKLGGRSETLFTRLAYDKVLMDGRMAIMVPSGLLFSTGSGELSLRSELLQKGALRAVISLPKDATQPYSSIPAHVLVIHKRPPIYAKPNDVWLYCARYDGFTSGRNRQPDKAHNDLPAIQAAVSTHLSFKPEEIPPIQIQPVLASETLVAYRLYSPSDIPIKVTRVTGSSVPHFLAEIGQPLNEFWLLAGENLWKIDSEPVHAQIEFLEQVSFAKGIYRFIDDDFKDVSLSCDGVDWKIGKDKTTWATVQPTKQPKNFAAFLVDGEGHFISPLFDFPKMLKDRQPPFYVEFHGEQSALAGHMVVFSKEGIFGKLLSGAGEPMYWFEHPNEPMLYARGKFEFYKTDPRPAYQTDGLSRGCLLDLQGEVLGVVVPAETILATKARDLQPSSYLPEKRIAIDSRSPAELLAKIKIDHTALNERLIRLMGIAELQPIAHKKIPPKVIKPRTIPGSLRGSQKLIWEAVRKKVEAAPGQKHQTPKPFQADDIEINAPTADIQRTLELFERLGLIVRVSYDGVLYYRLLAEGDLVRGAK